MFRRMLIAGAVLAGLMMVSRTQAAEMADCGCATQSCCCGGGYHVGLDMFQSICDCFHDLACPDCHKCHCLCQACHPPVDCTPKCCNHPFHNWLHACLERTCCGCGK